ncbi:MAG: hypothetical protein JW993_16935 [Sedimentisphaerales bacterium]|nr:hypothetical protein [Sedimentisphaerales bacterium]
MTPCWRTVTTMAVFFIAFYLYLWLVVEPCLIFHGAGIITNFPAFYTTRLFLIEHLFYPGGPAEYVAAFASQLFYYSWLGALVVTAQAWAFYLSVAFLLASSGFKRLSVVGYVPALLLLALYGRYTYYVPTTTALLAALTLACIYVALATRRTLWVGPAAFLALSFLCYYVAGGAFLLFAVVCIIHELISTRRWRFGLVYVVVAATLPYGVGVLAFDIYPADAYSRLLPISWKLLGYEGRRQSVELVYTMYLLTPATMVAAGLARALWARYGRGKGTPPKRKRAKRKGALWRYARSPGWRWAALTALLLAVATTVAFGSLDHRTKAQFAVDYYAYHEEWTEVIATGAAHLNDPSVMHAIDCALYHTGRLGNEMFKWPQRPEYLFLTETEGKKAFWDAADLYLEIGFINGAEHGLTECLEGLGERPMVLQRLALANMVKGNIGTARVYLGTLSHTLFHRAWARQYLDLLQCDPNLGTDARVQHLRSIALDSDFPSVTSSPERTLRCLLEKNPTNRMAFEYLMAWYLTTRQLPKFVERLGEFKRLGYTALPTHFEEAALIHVNMSKQPLYLGGYGPRADVHQRLEHFMGTMGRYQSNEQAARAEQVKYHAGDYFFYFVYGRPGGVN